MPGSFAADPTPWYIELDRVRSSSLLLALLVGLALLVAALFHFGVIGWLLEGVGAVVRGGIRHGFRLWEVLFSWATWPVLLAAVVGLLGLGGFAADWLPALTVLCGLVPLVVGVTACLAYMFIDLERYEVARGYKAVHNPLKGQEAAVHLARYGHRVDVPLLAAATVGMVGGFALLNQGLYETVGRNWYKVGAGQGDANYADFLAYALINLLGIVDVLNLAQSHHLLRATYVEQAEWPAKALLAGFRSFFTLVLLQQIFASLRQGRLLAETITDFWSPHEPIHERARNALPQFGSVALEPLFASLRGLPSVTKEQRDRLPLALAVIGPSAVPALLRHLHDPHESVRAIAAAALAGLHAVDAVPLLVPLVRDPSATVRQGAVEALGALGAAAAEAARNARGRQGSPARQGRGLRLFFWRREAVTQLRPEDPTELAVEALRSALADELPAVRAQAAQALGEVGEAAATPGLTALLQDPDETVRCQAAGALGKVGGADEATASALVDMLQDASGQVKEAVARALGALKKTASAAVPALVPLLQDREEAVRVAAADAISQIGPLEGDATESLVEGLASSDNLVRTQTAEALGTIGAAAEEAAPALVEAMEDGNDRVRAKAVEALGKIGEGAAEVAVPSLVRALHDQDTWVSALAAEALGQMGESADEAVPALIRSLGYDNPLIRGNAAEALGRMGAAAAAAQPALEKAGRDEDGAVRCRAVRALGAVGRPTPAGRKVVLDDLSDADPQVRAAAVEALRQWGESDEEVLRGVLPLLEDANDQVKVEVTKALPKLAGATPEVIDGLCRRLEQDDSPWVQVHAALALSKLGRAAAAAGAALLRAAQTAEADVREQAMRAIAMIQPPETAQAFAAGLHDASAEIRKVASGGWMNAAEVPEEVVPALVEALRDPEVQVRSNAAHALARLDALPAEAVPLLIECATDASDGLRMNAAMALRHAPPDAVGAVMRQLLEDANLRVRLIAAGSLLAADPGDAAAAVVAEALADPAPRVRLAALGLVESLGAGGATFREALEGRRALEDEAQAKDALGRILGRLRDLAAAAPTDGALTEAPSGGSMVGNDRA